jgi:hypothetical protein
MVYDGDLATITNGVDNLPLFVLSWTAGNTAFHLLVGHE